MLDVPRIRKADVADRYLRQIKWLKTAESNILLATPLGWGWSLSGKHYRAASSLQDAA